MGFFDTRKDRLEKKIYSNILRHQNKEGYAIIFKDEESPAYIYRFLGHTYVEARLDTLHWSLVKYIPDLTWEEAKKIKVSIKFVNPQKADKWISRKRKSPIIAIKKKIRGLFVKNKTTEYTRLF